MEELRSFFNNPCPSNAQVKKLRGPVTGGRRITKEDTINEFNKPEEHRHSVLASGTDYADAIKKKEMENYLKYEGNRDTFQSFAGGLDSLEQLSSYSYSMQNIEALTEEAMNEVYKKYSFQRKEDTNNLAINEYRHQILSSISAYPVVIIEGPTGCGKTTQVPQWILDDSFENRRPCKIVVTQPRRIAAISIAKRVAQERGWDVSGVVGYQVALEAKVSSDTRISYVTTGVLLQKLVAAKNMNEYTHVILDEVHERGQEMDFLLLVVKRLLYTVSPHVKVVLMSATINRKTFADYFMIPTPMGLQTAMSIKVVKKDPMYTVKIFYLNHLNKFGSILDKITSLKNESPGIPSEMHHLVIKLIDAFEQIDEKEENIGNRSEADLPSVLIFLPGINEIEELYDCLTNSELRLKMSEKAGTSKLKWWVLPLHSTITADEQVRVFQRAPPGQRKIILATNIAESSITVPDIKYVIDYCLMKVLVADTATNFTSLQLAWAAKANCEQRAGRAGRVRDGRVYRLVSERFYNDLPDECPPEIVRCPLERLVLLAKMLDMGPPSDILALAMDPPDMSNIHKTILVLKEVGAMKKTINDEWCVSDGDVTYLGRIMAKLPLDVRISKLIMLGYIYGCFDESIIMAAAMSVKNVFNSPFREKLNAYNSKLTWADGSTSDCIAFLNVYKVWNHLRKLNYFKQPGSEGQWARRFYVQVRALRELDDLVRELRARLSREGLEINAVPSPWAKHEITLVLKLIIAGAFYPQYFVHSSVDECREREAVRALGGLNPRRSLYFTGWPTHQPLAPYAPAIRNTVRRLLGDDPRVSFDIGSRKVFLTFSDGSNETKSTEKTGDPTIPGQVVLPVYKAVKARQIRTDFRIPLLPIEKANELAAAYERATTNVDLDKLVPRLPEIDDTHFPLKLSQYISVSKFWVQYDDESTATELRQIEAALNRGTLLASAGGERAGVLRAAPYVSAAGTSFYRARIVNTLPRDMLEVLYIDYGSYGRVSTCSVRELPAGVCSNTPPLAMRCSLAGVAPAPLLDHHAHWTPAADHLFTTLITRGRLLGKVYSVVNGVVSIELFAEQGKTSVNKALLDKGLAVPCEESYESKLNHDVREMANSLNMVQKRAYNKEQIEAAFYHMNEIDPPNYKECETDVCLKGPFSPLEISVHNLMYAGREKQVNIEWNSVNSVLLDTEPQEIYEKLLVAAQVGQNEMGSTLTLHHTTLMPNIPGLPAIIALLFCPAAELRRDERCTRYVSTLCGLGSHDDGRPYFPEHDILVNIDVDLDVDDIGLINHVRHLMDYMMFCSEGQDTPTADDEFHPKVPKFIREDIMKLLRKRRKHRESCCVANAWRWRSADESELLEISVPGMAERALVFALHRPLELHAPPRTDLLRLYNANQALHNLLARTSSSSSQELTCELCNTGPLPAPAMRIHLYSNMHQEKEDDLRDVQS
ncbi:PREDICTED: probable ATP-dependent RNA helicase spindle-E [Papilio xuthus]|uniref:Probable ATP-dependent RNA helicase spindle-E n=2 Tax=Papilio xuthus TaxID=66420 RepID=A0AAJ7EBW4_PAPXU|nr:PREDICTED: probable ATP-dependent RNA helicase spindle-E [Papilio xuthus]